MIKISPIIYNTEYRQSKKNLNIKEARFPKNNLLTSTNVNFGALHFLSQKKILSGGDFLEKISSVLKKNTSMDNINSYLINSISPENLLGEGTRQSAYKINGINDYALKIPNFSYKWGDFKIVEDDFPSLNLGQVVAECGDVKIAKMQSGIVSGVPYNDRLFYSPNNLETYKKHIIRTANMPQKAYDELANTFSVLNKYEKFFDYKNSNNILVDENAKKFNLVDDLTDSCCPQEINSCLSIIAPLLDLNYINQAAFCKNLIPEWRKIIDKSMIAAEKYSLPQPVADISAFKRALTIAKYEKP